MNKIRISNFIIKQAIQSAVLRSNQLSSLNRFAFYSSTPKNDDIQSKNPKLKISPKVTMINPDDKIEVVTLEQAKKIANRRDLKLVSILDMDTKTNRPVYKLMTGTEYHAEELKRREEKKEARKELHIKSEKLMTIGNKISEHDLMNKIGKCKKWIEKYHEVRVVVTSDDSESQKTEKMISAIESEVITVGGRILQKRSKDGTIRFTIMPTISKESKEPAHPEKKLLTPDHTVNIQQVRSFNNIAF